MTEKIAGGLGYVHVDVFSSGPYRGHSLPVFPNASMLDSRQMLQITQELRHFEAIFLTSPVRAGTVKARVFDLFGELPFAGHPILGAAAVLHHDGESDDVCHWRFELASKVVTVATTSTDGGFHAWLDQGEASFLEVTPDPVKFAGLFGLTVGDLHQALPLEVGSTGLRYLILPLSEGAIARARVRTDLTEPLAAIGAELAVLLDDETPEIRHWNNDGIVEDIATGSAAGVIGAYRLRHARVASGETFQLHQGRFTGRPSVLTVHPKETGEKIVSVRVGGHVSLVGHGTLEVLP